MVRLLTASLNIKLKEPVCTKGYDRVGSITSSYMGGPGFKSQSRGQLL
jgi:hypothetical protein